MGAGRPRVATRPRPPPRKVFLQCFDQIACVHMGTAPDVASAYMTAQLQHGIECLSCRTTSKTGPASPPALAALAALASRQPTVAVDYVDQQVGNIARLPAASN